MYILMSVRFPNQQIAKIKQNSFMVVVLRNRPFDKFPAVYRNIYVQSVVSNSTWRTEDIYSCLHYFCWKTEMMSKLALINLFWYDIYQTNSFSMFAFFIPERKFNIMFLLMGGHFIETSHKEYITSKHVYVVCLVKPSRLTFRYWCIEYS